MIRKIVKIDQEKCNGCGLCAKACHERAIIINENGKAELVKEDYCDGLGDCLPACPTGAIEIIEREAAPYDEEAVKRRIAQMDAETVKSGCGCISSTEKILSTELDKNSYVETCNNKSTKSEDFSNLTMWPVQIRLANSEATFFNNADLLIAADCTAYAFGNFHEKFMKNRVTLIGCPKLDSFDYEEKFYEILSKNDIRTVTLVRMEVPCCSGIEYAFRNALKRSGKLIPYQVVVLSLKGEIL